MFCTTYILILNLTYQYSVGCLKNTYRCREKIIKKKDSKIIVTKRNGSGNFFFFYCEGKDYGSSQIKSSA